MTKRRLISEMTTTTLLGELQERASAPARETRFLPGHAKSSAFVPRKQAQSRKVMSFAQRRRNK